MSQTSFLTLVRDENRFTHTPPDTARQRPGTHHAGFERNIDNRVNFAEILAGFEPVCQHFFYFFWLITLDSMSECDVIVACCIRCYRKSRATMWMSNFAIYLHLQLLEGANTVGSIVVVHLSLSEIGHRSPR